jgi:protease-4
VPIVAAPRAPALKPRGAAAESGGGRRVHGISSGDNGKRGNQDMATRADELIDRHRLRRKLTFWRIVALAVIAIAVGWAVSWAYRDEYGGLAVNHIAKVKIAGTITQNDDLVAQLEKIRKSPAVKGLILDINSPGGTTAGGEQLYDEVRRIAAEKPVVAEVGGLAASAAYMVAAAADHIVARKTSIVGSIGVLVEFPDVTGLMDKLGIKLEAIKSSPLKAEPSPFTPTTDDERAMVQRLISDSYDWFVGLVASRRPLSREEVLKLADGSIFTGRQAVANKLVDQIGGEREAVAWLEEKGVGTDLNVIEWKTGAGRSFFFSKALARLVGLPEGSEDILERLGADRIFLDGLLSVWHP